MAATARLPSRQCRQVCISLIGLRNLADRAKASAPRFREAAASAGFPRPRSTVRLGLSWSAFGGARWLVARVSAEFGVLAENGKHWQTNRS